MKATIFLIILIALFEVPFGQSPFYTTFDGPNENPISEGGKWTAGTDLSYYGAVKVLNGNAVAAKNAGVTAFNDCVARLTGTWAPDQEIITTIYRDPIINYGEVELILRMSNPANNIKCYECLCNVAGSACIVRWNGLPGAGDPGGEIDYLAMNGGNPDLIPPPGGLNDGDRLRGRIVGQTISFWFARKATPNTWVSIGSVTDNSAKKLTNGNPGMAFFKRTTDDPGGEYQQYGFKDYSATALGGTRVEATAVQANRGQDITLLPNPLQSNFTVTLPANAGQGSLSLYTVGGQLVKQLLLKDSQGAIPVQGLQNGVYILKVDTRNLKTARRLVVL